MTIPAVSVIIPSYNCANFLPEALDSVVAQTLACTEIIVVDDGSTDETAKVVESYETWENVKYVVQANRGPAAARNRGVAMAKGEFIAVLDADDVLPPTALEEMVAALIETDAQWCMIDVVKFWDNSREIQKTELPESDLLLGILKQDFIRRAMFFRRSVLEQLGMWDESIFGREDWDINIRLLKNRIPFVYLEKPLYHYRKRLGSITMSSRKRFLANTERLLKKHHRPLADENFPGVTNIYAANMWGLARRYFYEQRNLNGVLRCAKESMIYDLNPSRILHPISHLISTLLRTPERRNRAQ